MMTKVLLLKTSGNVATLGFNALEQPLRDQAESITSGIVWKPYRGFTVSQSFQGFQYRIADLPDTFSIPDTAGPDLDADNDGIADVAATLGGISGAAAGTYYGKDSLGNEGFHGLPLSNPGFARVEPDGGLRVSSDGANTWQISGGTVYFDNVASTVPAATAQTIPAALFAGNTTVYIYLKQNLTYEYRTSAPGATDPNDEICVGLVVSVNGGTTFLLVIPIIVDKAPLTQALLMAFNGIRVLNGLGLSKSTSALRFIQAPGDLVSVGRNWFNFTTDTVNLDPHIVTLGGSDPTSFSLMTLDGTIVTQTTFDLPFNGLNETGSTLSTLTGNNAGIWRIFQSSAGTLVALYPQFEYNSFTQALQRASLENWTRPANLAGFAEIAWVISTGNVDTQNEFNNDDLIRIVPVQGISAGSTGAPTLTSISPVVTGANIGTNAGEVFLEQAYKRVYGDSVTVILRFSFYDADTPVTVTLPSDTYDEELNLQLTRNTAAAIDSDITAFFTSPLVITIDREDIIVGSSPISITVEGRST
ncbi:virion structural protein [Acaryochloris phage A-HIS2]|nr:virion structural protein [Acaryochloris phage A-HIS2]